MHISFSKDRLLAESEACLLTRKTGKERVPDVITPVNSHSSWVCRYQVAQILDRYRRCSVLLSNGWLLAAGVCLVTAVSCVTKCTIQMRY